MTTHYLILDSRALASHRSGEVDAEQQRVGVVEGRLYHRPDCKHLEGVANSEQVPFVSPFDGLDADYFPCKDCDPGP